MPTISSYKPVAKASYSMNTGWGMAMPGCPGGGMSKP